MELHQLVTDFSPYIGVWSGQGRGYYPTIEDFEYSETLTFSALPNKPFVKYEQKTANPEGVGMHVEMGYLRFAPNGHIELVLAQPTGQTELLEGTFDAKKGQLVLETSTVVNSSTAKQVDATKRYYTFDGDQLTTEFHMAAVDTAMTQHLDSTLTRHAQA